MELYPLSEYTTPRHCRHIHVQCNNSLSELCDAGVNWYLTGTYSGFDADQPTSASGGKPKVAQVLKDTKGYKQLVFIGDGVTDAEACPPAVSLTLLQI